MRTLGTIMLGFCAALTAFAQAEEQPGYVPEMMNIYGAKLAYFPPPWDQHDAEAVKRTYSYKVGGRHVFMFEEVPEGETFENWNESYTITGFGGLSSSPEQDLEIWSKHYVETCGYENFNVGYFPASQSHVLLIVSCEKTPYSKKTGYGENVGTVAIVSYMRLGPVGVFSKHEWRGEAFDKTDLSTWPVTQDTLDGALERMMVMAFIDPKMLE